MNFNAFFLDKLNETNNLLELNTNKFNPNSYLFSNIIKVEEANSSQSLINQTNNQDLTESEGTTPTENVIHVSEKEITQLSDFITQFISSANNQAKLTEIIQNPSSIEFNKNKITLNEDGLNSLLEGIVQKISTQSQIYTKDINANSTVINDAKNIKNVTQSLLNLLNQANTLNLSFKTNSQKISINIVSDEQNAVNTDINFTKNVNELVNSVQTPNISIPNTNVNAPADKTTNTDTIKSENKNSNKIVNNIPVDNSSTSIYSAEITQIFSPTDNNTAYYTSNDNFTNQFALGDSSTNKFIEEYTSISTKQSPVNVFVQSSKSTYLNYSNLGISSNFISNQNLTPNDSSSNSNNQISELSAIYTNNTPFIQTNEKQTSEDKFATVKDLLNNGTITLTDNYDNNKTPIKNEDQINSAISSKKNPESTLDVSGNIQSSTLQTKVTNNNDSQELSNDLKLQTETTVKSLISNNDLSMGLQNSVTTTNGTIPNQSLNPSTGKQASEDKSATVKDLLNNGTITLTGNDDNSKTLIKNEDQINSTNSSIKNPGISSDLNGNIQSSTLQTKVTNNNDSQELSNDLKLQTETTVKSLISNNDLSMGLQNSVTTTNGTIPNQSLNLSTEKQASEDKSTTVKVLKNNGAILFSDLQSNSSFNNSSEIPVIIGDQSSSTKSTNTESGTAYEINGNIKTSRSKTNVSTDTKLLVNQEKTNNEKIDLNSSTDLTGQSQNTSNSTNIITPNKLLNQNILTEPTLKLKVTTNDQIENHAIISPNNMNPGSENKSTNVENTINTNRNNVEQVQNNESYNDISKQISSINISNVNVSNAANNFVKSVTLGAYSNKVNQQSDITSTQTTTTSIVGDPIMKSQSEDSNMSFLADSSNKSFLPKQLMDSTFNLIQKEIADNNQPSDKSSISQYSGIIESVNVSNVQMTTGETIKNLFSNRKVEINQNIESQSKPKDTIEQLKNIVGFSQSMRKLSFYDNSNTSQNTSDVSNNDSPKDKINEQNLVNDSIDNISLSKKSNNISIGENSSDAQFLSIKNSLSIKDNNIIYAAKSDNTETSGKYDIQSDFGSKDAKNQIDTSSNVTKTIDQIKNQDQQKNDSQPETISIDGNKALNPPVDPDAKTNKEVKNSSKVGNTVKDDGNNNPSDEKNPIVDTQTKSQDDKDFQKQKFAEIIRNNPVQNSTNTNDFEIEKIKTFTDLKTVNETVKTINVSDIIPEFSKVIQQNEKQSLTFQLTPDNLGKVKLVVDLVQNQINTRIVVENSQIKQFIQSNVDQLKQSLSSSGIDLNSVNISLADHEQKSNKSFSPRKKINGKLESINPTDNQQELAKKTMGYNTYEYLV
jgi:hypothetical protein